MRTVALEVQEVKLVANKILSRNKWKEMKVDQRQEKAGGLSVKGPQDRPVVAITRISAEPSGDGSPNQIRAG